MRSKNVLGTSFYSQPHLGPTLVDALPCVDPVEPAARINAIGDLWEEVYPNWEAAWIDLGGEG
jgi:hypothetical protein